MNRDGGGGEEGGQGNERRGGETRGPLAVAQTLFTAAEEGRLRGPAALRGTPAAAAGGGGRGAGGVPAMVFIGNPPTLLGEVAEEELEAFLNLLPQDAVTVLRGQEMNMNLPRDLAAAIEQQLQQQVGVGVGVGMGGQGNGQQGREEGELQDGEQQQAGMMDLLDTATATMRILAMVSESPRRCPAVGRSGGRQCRLGTPATHRVGSTRWPW